MPLSRDQLRELVRRAGATAWEDFVAGPARARLERENAERFQLSRQDFALIARWDPEQLFRNLRDGARKLRPIVCRSPRRENLVVVLDDGSAARAYRIAVGNRASVEFNVNDVVRLARKMRTVRVIAAHNHDGEPEPEPTPADVKTTMALARAFHAVGVVLTEHLIFGDECVHALIQGRNYAA